MERISTARGLGWAAVVAVAVVLARAARVALPSSPEVGVPACSAPVEVVSARGVHLACATDPSVRACGARAGDRVSAVDCELYPGQMAAATRLLAGVPLDLNRASATDLELLDGIGPKLSEAIVEERARAPFATVDDLVRVKGIGAGRLEAVRPFVTAK